jgi:hypothetical protein
MRKPQAGLRQYRWNSGGLVIDLDSLVLRSIQMIQHGSSLLVIPAKAGIYFRHGHRPSPV